MSEPLTEQEVVRRQKLERLYQMGISPYPSRCYRTHTAAAAIAAFEAGELSEDQAITLAGRLMAIRIMGKASFAHIEDGSGRIQLYIRQDSVGEAMYEFFRRDLDLGDFVEATGPIFRTRTGEVTAHVRDIRLLAKTLLPLPDKWHGLRDVETRYRHRYVDLMVNPDVRRIFVTRARIVQAIRRFLDDRGFLEVETPILQPIYGGAAARPFITHHNQLNQDLYLRISFELYLKRLLVGGYEKVYEIGRDFRNEGVSFKHNPEFTQLEFYWAYADYEKVMTLVEEMIAYVAQTVLGTTRITYQGNEIDLAPPWRRVTLRDAIQEHSGIDYTQHPTAEALTAVLHERGYEPPPKSTWGKLVDYLLGSQVEPHLIQPTFVLDYPRDISPLAKKKADDPTHVERFELFIGGMEVGNAFTELNDPLDQEQRFLEMGRLYAPEDEEAHPLDEDYLLAQRYGMPPNGGFGMGIDRFTMLLTDQPSIRDVILFPHLRSKT
ncbi:MAG: lysine--tRNA ligase [Anaerolineae bacterium]|nr:lysine--tRNA ligase [Anaerolineae bacterium]MDW8099036.1 lysine--tRNA ligase [Anaerolineae bacterium]